MGGCQDGLVDWEELIALDRWPAAQAGGPLAVLSVITDCKVKTYLEWRSVGTPPLQRAESTKSRIRRLPNFRRQAAARAGAACGADNRCPGHCSAAAVQVGLLRGLAFAHG